MERISKSKCFGGYQEVYSHASIATHTQMKFSIFLPEIKTELKIPVLYWLSGLTCSEQNFIQKAGAQRYASQYNVAIVACDTSPRGLNLPGEDDSYDFGSGAGFYVDATKDLWSRNYNMYSYVSQELPELVTSHFPVDPRKQGIFGHSMGGHGALVIGLRNPQKFRSISAFAPIAAPTKCPWGVKAFSGYLGEDRKTWEAYDAHLLVSSTAYKGPIFIDQGEEDEFLKDQLHPHLFKEACDAKNLALKIRYQPGYDHSYNFISTFVEDHIRFHSQLLAKG